MDKAQKKYRDMQREYYDKQSMTMLIQNHSGHGANPDYDRTLLQNCNTDRSWMNSKVFEFGCGCGRNILWLRKNARWCEEISGCDISANNIINTAWCITDKEKLPFADPREIKEENGRRFADAVRWSQENDTFEVKGPTAPYTKLYVSSGLDCGSAPSNHYDMVFSTIVLQHICVHSIRYSIMADAHRILAPNGIFSFQMGFDSTDFVEQNNIALHWEHVSDLHHRHSVLPSKVENQADYHEENTDATATNSDADVRITDPQDVITDLEKIGFKDVTYKITHSWQDNAHEYWIWFQARKS